jgi:hypothetical protein
MANLSNKIRKYLDREVDFYNEVLLQNDGQGDYISFWSNSIEKEKPTDEQLNALESQATALENNNKVRATRKNSYGDIGDQLDMLYKDMLAGKLDATGEWAKAIKKVKDDNPKS